MCDVMLICLCLWSLFGVFSCESVSVTEGDSVTLHINLNEKQIKEGISWKFGAQESVIAEINRGIFTLYEEKPDRRFKKILKLNQHTGDLSITNTSITHTGIYQVTSIETNQQLATITLTVYGVLSCEFVSVSEGDSVTLHMNLNEKQIKEGISWKFGAQESVIAEINRGTFTLYDDKPDRRFKNRLKLNQHTGDLSITNTSITHTGIYQVTSIETNQQLTTFTLTVYACLPVPVISRNSSQCSSSSENSNCSVLCSVMNVRHATLSWYNESLIESSISVSDLNIRLSLPLEVHYEDTNTYTCVLNNTITNHTQQLHINELCQPCSGFCSCGSTGAVIRLVFSALVGVATVAVLVYDITSRHLNSANKV